MVLSRTASRRAASGTDSNSSKLSDGDCDMRWSVARSGYLRGNARRPILCTVALPIRRRAPSAGFASDGRSGG